MGAEKCLPVAGEVQITQVLPRKALAGLSFGSILKKLKQLGLRVWCCLGVSPNFGCLFGDPFNKDYNIWRSILGNY